MSTKVVMKFMHDMGNNKQIARDLVATKKQLDEQGQGGDAYPIPVVAAKMVGLQHGYYFTEQDYMDALPEIKATYESAQPGGGSQRILDPAAPAQLDADGMGGQMADAFGWEDGDAGAMLGEAISSYWNQHADDWHVTAPSHWIHVSW
jgi:hypothetical protein